MHRATVTFLIMALVACTAGAQELVTNGTFDVDVSAWTVQNVLYGAIARVDLDAGSNPSSGSALITNSIPTSGGDLATTQCISALPADRDYVLSGAMRIADGTLTTGSSSIQIWFWEDSGCTVVVGSSAATPPVTTADTGWNRVRTTVTAPPSAVAARLTLWNTKNEGGGELAIHFDDVSLQPLAVFADDFESGNLAAWTTAP